MTWPQIGQVANSASAAVEYVTGEWQVSCSLPTLNWRKDSSWLN